MFSWIKAKWKRHKLSRDLLSKHDTFHLVASLRKRIRQLETDVEKHQAKVEIQAAEIENLALMNEMFRKRIEAWMAVDAVRIAKHE